MPMPMIEANPVKYYLAKYFFLAFAIIQWFLTVLILLRFSLTAKNFFVALIFFTIGMIFFFLFLLVTDKIRRVAIGKNKIVVIEGDRNIRFAWPEVKSIRIIPVLNVYKLKIKGKRNTIYFFPSKSIDPAFGLMTRDTSKMGSIVEKRKKELGIR
jgi:hypothetical protein